MSLQEGPTGWTHVQFGQLETPLVLCSCTVTMVTAVLIGAVQLLHISARSTPPDLLVCTYLPRKERKRLRGKEEEGDMAMLTFGHRFVLSLPDKTSSGFPQMWSVLISHNANVHLGHKKPSYICPLCDEDTQDLAQSCSQHVSNCKRCCFTNSHTADLNGSY